MKIQASYLEGRPDERSGMFVAEGQTAGRHCGFWKRIRPHADTVMAAVCCGEQADVLYVLARLEEWFYKELPQLIHPFSGEVVERYWYQLLCEMPSARWQTPVLSVFLIHKGQYVFCGTGEFAVYEYAADRKRCRRWHTAGERKKLDEELGIPVCDRHPADIFFVHRAVSENTFFFLLSRPIGLEHFKTIKNRHSFRKMMRRLAEEVPCAVAVRCTAGRRGHTG